MLNEGIHCEFCGKKEKAENVKKSVKFFINWFELNPGFWICRDCMRTKHDSNLVFYKMPINFRE
ncbi:MAG: hypothetical protein ACTSX4_12930 [Candidatus Helarchaeota archaeon]